MEKNKDVGSSHKIVLALFINALAIAHLCFSPPERFENSMNFVKTLKELKESGKTIVVATHDPIFFELDFVDKVFELKNGVLVE